MLSVKSTSLVKKKKKWHIPGQKCKKEKQGQLICTIMTGVDEVYNIVTCLDKKMYLMPHYCVFKNSIVRQCQQI